MLKWLRKIRVICLKCQSKPEQFICLEPILTIQIKRTWSRSASNAIIYDFISKKAPKIDKNFIFFTKFLCLRMKLDMFEV